MRRRIVRGSRFWAGQKVRVDGCPCGDYLGTVVKRITRLAREEQDGTFSHAPGIEVRVDQWVGEGPHEPFTIEARDSETNLQEK